MTDPSVWQLVRRAAARRLKRWADEILLEGEAPPAPGAATVTTKTPPAPPSTVDDVRIARGGPPANWLADIQKRAPHLIVDGQFLPAEPARASVRSWPVPLDAMTVATAPSPSVPRAAPAPRPGSTATSAPASATTRASTAPSRRPGAPGAPSPVAPHPAGDPPPRRAASSVGAPPRRASEEMARADAPTPAPHMPRRPLDLDGAEARREDADRPAVAPARRPPHGPTPAAEPPRASPYRSKVQYPGQTARANGADPARGVAPATVPAPRPAKVWERPFRRDASAPPPGAGPRPGATLSAESIGAMPPAPRPLSNATRPAAMRAEHGVSPARARAIPDGFADRVAARQPFDPAADPWSGARRPGAHAGPGAGRRATAAAATASSPFPRTSPPRDQAPVRAPAPADPAAAADPWPTLPPTPALDAPDADDLALDLAAHERRRRLRREQAGVLT